MEYLMKALSQTSCNFDMDTITVLEKKNLAQKNLRRFSRNMIFNLKSNQKNKQCNN